MDMTFDQVKEFMTSWGYHFDTPDGEANDLIVRVFEHMKADALSEGGSKLKEFIEYITDTTDGRAYMTVDNWDEVQKTWESGYKGELYWEFPYMNEEE